ncbi:hypothetical protein PH547_33645 [Rhizobium sp. CNPSo 3464]|uniref:hypothetical protein n=1 Tax=Rhizobium sp. CNPSo 3464 TaxID=3021406 RepID=UPI000DDB2377|nr:hypothetical protein [Rhizobium sp. CNPSo 3464]MDK4743778.1 hypothetical protein [Rhizobium sp. CNPSo 3464]
MNTAHPVAIANLREITGHVRPMALANAIHARVPSSWGGAFFITLNNIRDCIEAGDRWFEEEIPEGFRVWTDSGFSCIVRDRLAFCSATRTDAKLITLSKDENDALAAAISKENDHG